MQELREKHGLGSGHHADVSAEVLEQACEAVHSAPDVRAERVLEACTRLLTAPIDSHDLADKVISRIASDALR